MLEQCLFLLAGKRAWDALHPETKKGAWVRDLEKRNDFVFPTFSAVAAESAPFSQRMAQYYLAVGAKLCGSVTNYLLENKAELANSYSELEKLSSIKDEELQLKVARLAAEENKKIADVLKEMNLSQGSKSQGTLVNKLTRLLTLSADLHNHDLLKDPHTLSVLEKEKFVAHGAEIYCTTKAVADFYAPFAEATADQAAAENFRDQTDNPGDNNSTTDQSPANSDDLQ